MDDLRLHTLGEVFLRTHSASLQTSPSDILHLRSLLALLFTSFLGLVRGVNIWNSLRGHRSCRRALFAHHPTQVDTSVDSTNPPETGTKGLLAHATGARDGLGIPTRNCHQASICNRPWAVSIFLSSPPNVPHVFRQEPRCGEYVAGLREIHTRARLVSHPTYGQCKCITAVQKHCPLAVVDWVDRYQSRRCFSNPACFLNVRLKSSTQQAYDE